MVNDDIAENVLRNGKDGIKQNIMQDLEEFASCYADEMWQAVSEVIKLREENVALRERLSKAVELPFEVGSIVYSIHETDEEDKFNPWIDVGKVVSFSFDDKLWIFVQYNSGLTMWYTKDTFDKEVCLTLEAAEARLAEMKGQK